MYVRNIIRERKIYELRQQGLTIDAISDETGIPRSTVGYYTKKFKKRTHIHREYSDRTTGQSTTKAERIIWAGASAEILKRFGELWRQSNYKEINEMVNAYFGIHKLTNHINNHIAGEEEITLIDIISTLQSTGFIK